VPQWSFDTTVQYNPKTSAVDPFHDRRALQPGQLPRDQRRLPAASAAYSEQVDIGWQWPLNDLWGDKGQDLGAGRARARAAGTASAA
jgi:LPS-assembly protein